MRGLLLSCSLALAGCGLTLDLTPPVGDAGGSDGGVLRDAGLDAIPADAAMCRTVEDCAGLVRIELPSPCGDWRCDRGFCLANDLDADGVGPGCEDERDCDDGNELIGVSGTIPCPDAEGICGAGATLTCTDGEWADSCEGEQPSQPERCNGLDDDCDGRTDEDVEPRVEGTEPCVREYTCVGGAWMSPERPGSVEVCDDLVDDDCDGTIHDPECVEDCTYVAGDVFGLPVGTLSSLDAAISAGAPLICLIADPVGGVGSCAPTDFPLNLDIPSDTAILGGFATLGDGSVGRCDRDHLTRIVAGEGSNPTVRTDGEVQLLELAVEYPAEDDAVAIEVVGGRLLTSNVAITIPADEAPEASTGIQVNPGASLVAVRTDVNYFGYDSTGIDAEGDVALFDGCASDDCACEPAERRGIFGRGEGRGVVVREASLVMERYAVCGNGGSALELDMAREVFIANSAIETFNAGTDALYASCDGGDAHPGFWLHENQVWVRDAEGDSTGISLHGSCGALLTSNTVHGLANGAASSSIGVYCDGVDCALSRNFIYGTDGSSSVGDSYGLVCKSDSGPGNCRFVTDNVIVASPFGAGMTMGVSTALGLELLDSSFSYLAGNQITGGCGTSSVTGLFARGSTILGQANRVVALDCTAPAMGFHVGMDVMGSGVGTSWVGNTVHGGHALSASMGADCEAFGALIEGRSILRNNLFIGSESCSYSVAADIQGANRMLHNGFTIADDLLYYNGDVYDDAAAFLADHPLFVGHVFDSMIGARGFDGYPSSLRPTTESPFYGAGAEPGGRTEDGGTHEMPPSIGAYEP